MFEAQENPREEQKFKRTTVAQFLQLYEAKPDTIAVELLHDLKSFQKVVLNSDRVGQRQDMHKIVGILLKLTLAYYNLDSDKRDKANRILAETFSLRSSKFFLNLKQYIQKIRNTQDLFDVIYLLDEVLKLLPSSWVFLPVEDLKLIVSESVPEVTSNATFMSMISNYCYAQRNEVESIGTIHHFTENYCEYRRLPILPNASEINTNSLPTLYPNIVEGYYDSWEHYYDVQFRLLKEDFVAPLRRGVCGFREGLRGRDISDVRVYNGVAFTGLSFGADGILLSIQFDSSRFQRVNWEHSKRLIYGSLLCFSNNNFDSIIFASVTNRDPLMLKQGKLTVKMECDANILQLISNKHDLYTMIESQAHYETYYHILNSLQNAEFDTMPFTEILIESKCRDVQPPAYMCLTPASSIDHSQLVFNMKDALDIDEKYSELYYFDVTRPECWPSVEHVQLNESQLEAIKMALTQKVSVIQGPPGTGKTYIGMKIVQALLTNRHVWDPDRNSPLLVVCYTNHALDQFLEGIIDLNDKYHLSDDGDGSDESDFNDWDLRGYAYDAYTNNFSIVRVGSRCQSKKVEKYCIKNYEVRRQRVPKYVHGCTQELKEGLSNAGTKLDLKLKIIQQTKEPYLHLLVEFIAPDHIAQLLSLVNDTDIMLYKFKVVRGIELWLSCEDLKRPVGTNSDCYDNELSSESEDDDDGSDGRSIEAESANKIKGSFLHNTPIVPVIAVTDTDVQELISKEISDNTCTTILKPSNMTSIEEKTNQMDMVDQNCKGAEDTVSVVGEAELAETQRMIDDPADVFHYEDINGYDEVPMPKSESSTAVPTTEFASFPEGPFTYNVVSKIDDIFRLSEYDRRRLYTFWKQRYIDKLYNHLHTEFDDYLAECKEYKNIMQREDLYVLEDVDLIGMTTTGAAKYQHIIQRVKPKIVVVEEAAEVLESHIVSCLTAATQQLILIGDHKQLRPKPNENYLAHQYNLDISLFERLITVGIPHATLEIQHRMRPEIAGLVCPYIYPKIDNHESVLNYEDVRGVATNMYFFDHKYPETENTDLKSHSNEEEAKLVVALCNYFLKQGYSPSKITVLTAYIGQVLKLKSLMPRSRFEGVKITAVDNFQGEENDIILLSFVRSNKNGNVGFLKKENRTCVALSRAKKGFYCFGNFDLLRESCITWDAVLTYLEEIGQLGSSLMLKSCSLHTDMKTVVHRVDDFNKVPKGGCIHLCGIRLECGHACNLCCHVRDPSHNNYVCRKPCGRKCERGHACPMICSQPCSKCMIKVEKVIPSCSHTQNVPCHLEPSLFKCKTPCSLICNNGHSSPKFCYEICSPCEVMIEQEIPKCGHTQSIPCHLEPSFYECKAPCSLTCNSGHPCHKLCYETCPPCEVIVKKEIPKCGHTQKVPCNLEPSLFECKAQCTLTCNSGHPCSKLCYEICSPCEVLVEKKIPKCGHIQNVPCHLNEELFVCKAPCTKRCLQGHLCPKHCSDSCGPCQTIVNKRHPSCGHLQSILCHHDPTLCQHPCEKTCSTNPTDPHKCDKLCSQPCVNCMVPVLRNLPHCGHEHSLPCCFDPNEYRCPSPCNRNLICGHPCTNKCGMDCTTYCKVKIEKKFSKCKHSVVLPCSKNTEEIKCLRKVVKKFSGCGHDIELPCSVSADEVSCQEGVCRQLPCGHEKLVKYSSDVPSLKCRIRIKKNLKCGHTFEGKCYKSNSKCTKLSEKTFPLCGHKLKLPCFEDLPVDCTVKCVTKLLCGHQCTGNCTECHQGRMHKPCAFHVFSLPCGHPANVKNSCISITFPTCDYKCEYSCAHRKACVHDCSQPCDPCNKPCLWKCPHYICSKKCHEICDRPRCDHPCENILQCKHPCIGVCGEPCPRICRICRIQRFKDLCVGAPDMRNETRYIQLSCCNYLFEINTLDQVLDEQSQGNMVVQPPICPACSKCICFSYRYGNVIKKKKEMVEISHSFMKEPITQRQQDDILEKLFSNSLPNEHKIEPLVQPKNFKYLPQVFKMLTDTVCAGTPLPLGSLNIVENEIDQYISLKKCLSLCEQFPDLLVCLQELFAFFEETPPSVQKFYDISCEKQRILLLWTISTLKLSAISELHNESHGLQQLEKELILNKPKLTLFIAGNHYDELLKIAKGLEHIVEIDEYFQPIKAVFFSGVWTICPQNHVYCVPRVLKTEKEMLLCPKCAI